MSLQVKIFDLEKAKKELKNCPKIVKDYVRLLEENSKRWQELVNHSIQKLREKT